MEKSGLKFDDFCDFLEDLGKTLTPELFGVHTNWEEIIEEKVRVIGSQRRTREDKEREIVLRSKIELELKTVSHTLYAIYIMIFCIISFDIYIYLFTTF